MDHRQGMRHRALTIVEIQGLPDHNLGLMHDISNGGMFVLNDSTVAVNQSINIHLPSSREHVWIRGMVVHRQTNGFGLIFREPDETALAAVVKFINRINRID